jgi:hypothetical protein
MMHPGLRVTGELVDGSGERAFDEVGEGYGFEDGA